MSPLTKRQLEYENAVICEPLLTELLQSKALQRLKHVAMGEITSTLGVLETSSRFEHSVGVMCLVRSLGGSLQEQAAALLHDVSHTAFSHVIDLVFEDTSRGSFSRRSQGRLCPSERHSPNPEWSVLLEGHGERRT